MAKPDLRIFSGEESAEFEVETPCPKVTVKLGDIAPLLVDAVQSNRLWLEDFGDDPIDIPQDLYEVLLAYRQMHRRAA